MACRGTALLYFTELEVKVKKTFRFKDNREFVLRLRLGYDAV
jgi:hypothetical protein